MQTLDKQVRGHDEDRWLASRFAGAAVRQRLTSLYALHYEIARVGEFAREPAVGVLRLAWWRDAIRAVRDGGSPAHPTLAHYAASAPAFSLQPWLDLIEARGAALGRQLQDWQSVDDYAVATAGALMRLALEACHCPPVDAALVHACARAWAISGMLRSASGQLPAGSVEGRARAGSAYQEAQILYAAAPAEAFPALGYVALTPLYLGALRRRQTRVPLLRRQLCLIAASARGRL